MKLKNNRRISLKNQDLAELLKDTLNKKAHFRFKVKGFSMFPFIRDNDVVIISPLSNNSIKLGNVVAFIQPQTKRLVIHRIIGKRDNRFIIKGDNSFKIDGLVVEKNILGYVSEIEREGKKIFLDSRWKNIFISVFSIVRLLSLFSFCFRTIYYLIENIKRILFKMNSKFYR